MTAVPPLLRRFYTRSLDRGLRVSATCNGLLVVWFYAVVAHTHDIRARIPIVVGILSPIHWLVIFALLSAVGLGSTSVIGGLDLSAAAGALLGALLNLVLVATGLVARWIPARYDSPPRYWLFAFAVLVATLILWFADRRGSRDRMDTPP